MEGELLVPQDSNGLHVDGLAGSHDVDIAKAGGFDGPLLSNLGTGASGRIVAYHGETFVVSHCCQLANRVLWVAHAKLENHVSDFRSNCSFQLSVSYYKDFKGITMWWGSFSLQEEARLLSLGILEGLLRGIVILK